MKDGVKSGLLTRVANSELVHTGVVTCVSLKRWEFHLLKMTIESHVTSQNVWNLAEHNQFLHFSFFNQSCLCPKLQASTGVECHRLIVIGHNTVPDFLTKISYKNVTSWRMQGYKNFKNRCIYHILQFFRHLLGVSRWCGEFVKCWLRF
jgi:hypothetical protein